MRSSAKGAVRLGPVEATGGDGGHRVSAAVDGVPLWYESPDTELDDGPESLAGAMLLPALTQYKQLVIDGAVSPTWLANIERATAVWHEWWGYPVLPPSASALVEARERRAGTALCFTGGLDSFHTLLTAPTRPDVLAFAHGFAVRRDNQELAKKCETMLRDVAGQVGARSVLLRTNHREHPLVVGANGVHAVGGGLAAIGHLLSNQVGTLLISSSFSRAQPVPIEHRFGTDRELDPLMSSDRLEIVHYAADSTRVDKVRAVADHELVHHHLRVCNGGGLTNCSHCDKCVWTMAIICAVGADPARFRVFDWSKTVVERLDHLHRTQYLRTYSDMLELDIEPAMARAIRALLDRSRPPEPSLVRRVARRAGRWRP